MATKLTEDALEQALIGSAWNLQDGKLQRKFKFKNFVQAFGFLTQVAIYAEKMNHHPEIYNVYNNVTIDLVTHDVDGISEFDLELAKIIDTLAA
ncbi:MAG: 4a-hydroxytetrahydrobiopterin dehydratase [Deinococcota bacterium]